MVDDPPVRRFGPLELHGSYPHSETADAEGVLARVPSSSRWIRADAADQETMVQRARCCLPAVLTSVAYVCRVWVGVR